MMVLQFYFQSFDYETLIISQELFIDFLCMYLNNFLTNDFINAFLSKFNYFIATTS